MGFENKKRQQFLIEDNFITFADHYREYINFWANNIGGSGETFEEKKKLALNTHADYSYNLFSLLFTSGYEILALRLIFEDVIIAYEKYTIALRVAEKDNVWAPFYFTAIDEYERCMQLIGWCYLLYRRDLLPRITAMQDKIYHDQSDQTDTLYEDFLSFELNDRYDIDQWFYDDPYRPLIFSKYRDTKEESIQDIQEYLKLWYPAFESAPWHDLHKMENGGYFGYWAIEAAAYVYLLELDDSEISHMVYPKDLVKFAREFVPSENDISNPRVKTLRCEAGQICPKTGEWYSPANNMEKQHFNQGDIMPEIKNNPWGLTIWYMTE